MSTGKVWLVGAGPGDEGLLTVKGKYLLEQADTIVYDRLVGAGILAGLPTGTTLIDVGKYAGRHPVPQEEINQILLQEALKGNRVVRLKGGDPFVFGRGGEELALLKQHGIPFEVVPGITSAVGAAAYAGIPVTHRGISTALHIITAHHSSKSEKPDYHTYAKIPGTLVFLMGVGTLPEICGELIKAGKDEHTPAAVVQEGTTAAQKMVTATLGTLTKRCDEAGLRSPAVILVGEVCALTEDFCWRKYLPLSGKRIIITRPRKRISKLKQRLADFGAEVIALPTIQTKPLTMPQTSEQVLRNIDRYAWIAFTSADAVEYFFDCLQTRMVDIRTLAGTKFAVIGPATKEALKKHGIIADYMPDIFSGQALGEGLAAITAPSETVLLPRSAIGSDRILSAFRQEKLAFTDLPIYTVEYPSIHHIPLKQDDIILFTSASAVDGFMHHFKDCVPSSLQTLCIGELTAKQAVSYGMKPVIAPQATLDSMVDTLLDWQEHQSDAGIKNK